MRPYIAGPMTGYPEHNFPAFNEAEKVLRELGHDPINPVHHADGVGTDMPYVYYIRESILDVMKADSIVMLKGWSRSKGAYLELHIANTLGYPSYSLKDDGTLKELEIWTSAMWDAIRGRE